MTDRAAIIEAMAKAMYEARNKHLKNCYSWDDTELDNEHPDCRPALYRDAKAALAAVPPAPPAHLPYRLESMSFSDDGIRYQTNNKTEQPAPPSIPEREQK